MLESLKRILDRLSNFDLASWLNSITISGYKVGLDTAQKDLKEEYPFLKQSEPDMEAIVRIGMRAHALSEKAIARAKGGMVHNADKLYQEMDAAMKAGMSEKEALFQIQGRLKRLFTDSYQEWELERLVRDQFLVATKEGRRAGWQKGGMKYRQWKIHLDNKTAADSKRMEGQITEIDKPYTDPLTGEKYMLAHIRPNDRCFSVGLWELPEDTVERNGLIYAKNAESDFVKGGVGSGIKGHRTYRPESKIIKDYKKFLESFGFLGLKHEVDNITKNTNKGFEYDIDTWYYGDMKNLTELATNVFGLDSGNTRGLHETKEFRIKKDKKIRERLTVATYLITQEYCKRKYKDISGKPSKNIKVYRGIDGKTYREFRDFPIGTKVEIDSYNVSSWSESEETATKFATGQYGSFSGFRHQGEGVVLEMEIPVKQILLHHALSSPGIESIQEITVMGELPKVKLIGKYSLKDVLIEEERQASLAAEEITLAVEEEAKKEELEMLDEELELQGKQRLFL